MTTRDKLEGFLAKFLDKATTEAEAQGAVAELVRRLRLLHAAGEDDLVLVLVTRDEKRQLDAHRSRVAQGEPPRRDRAHNEEPVEPFRRVRVPMRDVLNIAGDLFDLGERMGIFDDREPHDPSDDGTGGRRRR